MSGCLDCMDLFLLQVFIYVVYWCLFCCVPRVAQHIDWKDDYLCVPVCRHSNVCI